MNKFELSAYGVEEMSLEANLEYNGGWFLPFLAGAIFGGMVYELISDPKGCLDAIKDGIDAALEDSKR